MTIDAFKALSGTLDDLIECTDWTPTRPGSEDRAAYAARYNAQRDADALELEVTRRLYHARKLEKTPEKIDKASGLSFADLAIGARRLARAAAAELGLLTVRDGGDQGARAMVSDVFAGDPREEGQSFLTVMLDAATDAEIEEIEQRIQDHYEVQKAEAEALGLPVPPRPPRLPDLSGLSDEQLLARFPVLPKRIRDQL